MYENYKLTRYIERRVVLACTKIIIIVSAKHA